MGTLPENPAINNELQAVYEGRRIRNFNRRHLLQVLHSSRAVDTCIKAVVVSDGHRPTNGMGSALVLLRNSGIRRTRRRLSHAMVRTHQRDVVNIRNKYLHKAAEFPVNSAEVSTLLSNMVHFCKTFWL